MELVRSVALPCAQGDIEACAHISVSVAAVVLRNGRDAVRAPLVVCDDMFVRATERAIAYYKFKLAARRQKHPADTSRYFHAEDAVREFAARVERPWFDFRAVTGYVNHYAEMTDVNPANPPITLPRLVDELIRAQHRARRESVDQALILTCRQYTRTLFVRTDGLWLYDSHGYKHSTLYYYDSIDALATHVLRLCGVTESADLARNLAQMHNPALRTVDCNMADNRPDMVPFDLVILENRQ